MAGYTDIIEQGVEQQQGAMPMTTAQKQTNLMTDDHLGSQLDSVAGGTMQIQSARDREGYAVFDNVITDLGSCK